jgi:hypothetical protein
VIGIAILWPLFRRWKLRRQSSALDERLRVQPTDLHPSNAGGASQRRFTTGGNIQSFNTVSPPLGFELGPSSGLPGSGHSSESMQGSSGSEHSHPYRHLDDDFAASLITLIPVYGDDDLARVSNPQPQMHQVDIMTDRSVTPPPSYDVAVLLHHY